MSKNKLKRNDPCYCGSGRKYKKCCLRREDRIMEKKENTFAKEVEASNVSPAEEMNRNQAVHLITLRSEKEMLGYDINHLGFQMTRIKARQRLICSMPDCECKHASLSIIDQRIEKLEQAIEASQFNGVSEMTLDALERLANLSLQVEGAKEASVN